jgi:hypothetical protein
MDAFAVARQTDAAAANSITNRATLAPRHLTAAIIEELSFFISVDITFRDMAFLEQVH